MAETTVAWTDRAGRPQRFTDDPQTTAPAHSWDDPDGDGHNCQGCPVGGVWRCDALAHPEHDPGCFTLRDPRPVYDDGTLLECDCQVWRTIRAYQAGNLPPLGHKHALSAHNGYCVVGACTFDGWTAEERKRRESAGRKVQR